ncbi:MULTISPECIES: helix-turn-helix domain-containing protein [unclassified Plantibacter]|uniref:helix-turn-helix domain-containing protein n=1 Tax=unclassified Plantibacter TaxID=2624265 RepID=UPI003D34E05D
MVEHSEAAKILGERLRSARQERQLTLEDLGELAEMHWTNIGKIERGQVHPSVETLVRLSSAMDLDAAQFVQGLNADMYPGRTHKLTAKDLIAARKQEHGTD